MLSGIVIKFNVRNKTRVILAGFVVIVGKVAYGQFSWFSPHVKTIELFW
jgi:hypothetical protein